VERFVEQIARLSDGTIEVIEVRHGLPFRMVIEASGSPCPSRKSSRTAWKRRRTCGPSGTARVGNLPAGAGDTGLGESPRSDLG
jgi:hypothetical protein